MQAYSGKLNNQDYSAQLERISSELKPSPSISLHRLPPLPAIPTQATPAKEKIDSGTVTTEAKIQGTNSNTKRKVSTSALTCFQLIEFAKIATVLGGRTLQSIGKTQTASIQSTTGTVTEETKEQFKTLKDSIGAFSFSSLGKDETSSLSKSEVSKLKKEGLVIISKKEMERLSNGSNINTVSEDGFSKLSKDGLSILNKEGVPLSKEEVIDSLSKDGLVMITKEELAKLSKEKVVDTLREDGLAILLKGTVSDENGNPIKDKREAFVDHLKQVKSDTHKPGDPLPNPNTISMKELLGPEGMKMYMSAIKEEKEDATFRMNVFGQSMQHFEGDAWEGQVITYIGGPSASGKSFAAETAMKLISEQMGPNDRALGGEGAGNDVVAVDGGIERKASQMRSLVLQIALSKGFDGISDLQSLTDDKSTGPKIKGQVEEAALAKNLSLVIPNTFVADAAGSVRNMEKFHQQGIKQRFVEVAGTNEHTFKETVCRQGESRAYMPGGNPDIELSLENLETGCESKRYESEVFEAGVKLSGKTMEYFQKITGEDVLRINNDRMFVKEEVTTGANGQENRSLRRARPNDPTGTLVAISERQYIAYMKSGGTTELEVWLKANRGLGAPLPEVVKAPVKENVNAQGDNSKTLQNTENELLVAQNRKRALSDRFLQAGATLLRSGQN